MLSTKSAPLPERFSTSMSVSDARRLAAHLGISERICCGAPSKAARRASGSHFSKVIPAASTESLFIHLGSGLYIPCPELIFLEMAAELSLIELIRFGYDLCGTYIPGHGTFETMYDVRTLTNAQKLISFCEEHKGCTGIKKAQRAASYVIDGSASPAESNLAMMLSLPMQMGGYGAPRPELNVLYGKTRSNRFPDLFWRKKGIDLEYDSDLHTDMTADAIRRNQLQPKLKVLTATKQMTYDLDCLDRLALDFFAASKMRFRPQARGYTEKKRHLHSVLYGPEWYLRPPQGSYSLQSQGSRG